MKLTTMVQNWARVSTWPGLNWLPPVPDTTPHQAQHVGVEGGDTVGDVAEGGAPRRRSGKGQAYRHGGGQQCVNESILSHKFPFSLAL